MTNEITPTYLVTKSNEIIDLSVENVLTETLKDMNLQEVRFLAFVCSLLPKGEANKPRQDVPYVLEFTIREFAKQFEIPIDAAYPIVKKSANKLIRRSIEFIAQDGAETETGILSTRKYYRGEGRIKVIIDADLLPYYMGLSKNYTQYTIKDVHQFKSTSTWWLYELLKEYLTIGYREIEIDDLRDKLHMRGKYGRTNDLKKFVIDPSVKEINETSDLKVEYEQRKRGRVIVALKFFIRKQPPKSPLEQLKEKNNNAAEKAPEFKKILKEKWGLHEKEALKISNLAHFQNKIEELTNKLPKIAKSWEKLKKKGKAKVALPGYIFASLQNELLEQGSLPLK